MVKKRYVILDALRCFAILGICLANFPEFSLWTFSDPDGWTHTDKVTRVVQTFLIDGKFYTLFSLLFGMGFSIQLENAGQKTRTFYRRMVVLFFIGLIHLLFLWSGDILMLYATMGMLLPLFKRLETRKILIWGGAFLVLPVICEAIFGTKLSDPLLDEQWRICALYGITEANFGTWLAEITGYRGMLQFLHQGAVERMWEFVVSYRFFKVLGLFLIGYGVGRMKVFADLSRHRGMLKKVLSYGLLLGVPASIFYTLSSMKGEPFGATVHSLFYLLGVYPMGFAYAAGFSLLFNRSQEGHGWQILAKAGRMACTNYLSQSVIGVLIFYGIGFGLGAKVGLLATEAIAVGVLALQIAFSALWLKFFNYGPVEWVWRMLTYGRIIPMIKEPLR
ncbi:MAG: DUF418 domain-containing protein [Bacteroidales bacterium]|nr:DUF418 domain-containing protein [Bacteroidales bacterium]